MSTYAALESANSNNTNVRAGLEGSWVASRGLPRFTTWGASDALAAFLLGSGHRALFRQGPGAAVRVETLCRMAPWLA